MKTTLEIAWKKRNKLWEDVVKLRAEADNIMAKGDKLWAEADNLWLKAVSEIKGDISINWQWVNEKNNYRCVLETGEVFEP